MDRILIDEQNMVHIAESTVGRRYAGWFIKNAERTQRILDELKKAPLAPSAEQQQRAAQQTQQHAKSGGPAPSGGGKKVAWGGAK